MNLFRSPDCTCLELADAMAYEFERVELPLCSVHQRAEIAEREAAQLRAVADAEQARFREVRASLEPSPPVCSCPDVGTSLRAALEGLVVAECAAHPTTSPSVPSSSIALNDDASLARIISAAFGQIVPLNQHPGDDLPPAA